MFLHRNVSGAALPLAAALGGCSAGEDLVATGAVSLGRVESQHGRVTWVEARRRGGGTDVTGGLVRGEGSTHRVNGHVDVALLDAEGRLVRSVQTPEMYVRPSRPGHGLRQSRFAARLPVAAADGSRLRVTYHPGPPCGEGGR